MVKEAVYKLLEEDVVRKIGDKLILLDAGSVLTVIDDSSSYMKIFMTEDGEFIVNLYPLHTREL